MTNILLVFNKHVHDMYLSPVDLKRFEKFADWDWLQMEGGPQFGPNSNPDAIEMLVEKVHDAEGLVICHGSPLIGSRIMDEAPKLRIIGELEGDRFAYRIDLQEAWERGIQTVDTTNGSSYPVAEWALGLILISLKNAGAYFRRIITGDTTRPAESDFGYLNGELYGKNVGFVGCGHIGRRLIKFLTPFNVKLTVFDPYIAPETADILNFTRTTLDNVLSTSDVIVCLAPLTQETESMIGARELALITPNSVFVNVSRGRIVDSKALIERLKKGDIVAGLDVFDPEPLPKNSEIIDLPNVFLSPHIAGVTLASRLRFFNLMVDELSRFFHGHDTRYNLTEQTRENRTGVVSRRRT